MWIVAFRVACFFTNFVMAGLSIEIDTSARRAGDDGHLVPEWTDPTCCLLPFCQETHLIFRCCQQAGTPDPPRPPPPPIPALWAVHAAVAATRSRPARTGRRRPPTAGATRKKTNDPTIARVRVPLTWRHYGNPQMAPYARSLTKAAFVGAGMIIADTPVSRKNIVLAVSGKRREAFPLPSSLWHACAPLKTPESELICPLRPLHELPFVPAVDVVEIVYVSIPVLMEDLQPAL